MLDRTALVTQNPDCLCQTSQAPSAQPDWEIEEMVAKTAADNAIATDEATGYCPILKEWYTYPHDCDTCLCGYRRGSVH
jgi:hypothetical protein